MHQLAMYIYKFDMKQLFYSRFMTVTASNALYSGFCLRINVIAAISIINKYILFGCDFVYLADFSLFVYPMEEFSGDLFLCVYKLCICFFFNCKCVIYTKVTRYIPLNSSK